MFINTQQRHLANVGIEPQLWHKPFPTVAYQKLFTAFLNLLHSSRCLCSATIALKEDLMIMIINEENISAQIHYYDFVIARIFGMVSKTNKAFHIASIALHKLYEHNDLSTDITKLIGLSKHVNRLLDDIDAYFIEVFLKNRHIAGNMNTQFILAWQNMCEGLGSFMKNLSNLGVIIEIRA